MKIFRVSRACKSYQQQLNNYDDLLIWLLNVIFLLCSNFTHATESLKLHYLREVTKFLLLILKLN